MHEMQTIVIDDPVAWASVNLSLYLSLSQSLSQSDCLSVCVSWRRLFLLRRSHYYTTVAEPLLPALMLSNAET